ncbi:acyl-CoA thioesterase [Leptothermofonsia sp. ETS-13]|uniref:acyl-CoA thioesterase n=1 Tax=Leptothermofonsia sp. ETS-13 TaxID=3035696 RepID=UPI003BA2D5A0
MPFSYQRIVHFQDTDAAGVVYFATVLAMCHEAYEASLAAAGIDLKCFFQGQEVAVPVVHASVNFFAPMFCGDRLTIQLTPRQLRDSEFEVEYAIFKEKQLDSALSTAKTRHVCIAISSTSRTRRELSSELVAWLRQWS